MDWSNRALDRRQFLERGVAALAAFSPLSLGILSGACGQRAEPKPEKGSSDSLPYRKLRSEIRGQLILPGDGTYESARHVWNLAVDRHPAAIVGCAEVEDVVKAVEFARTHAVEVAVRSGGHSFAGYSVCDGGMVIDLGSMTDVQVDSTNRIAHVSAGARVGGLLRATSPLGLATPTGGCAGVGIAGLTLGGGENALMAKYGAVCDSVLSARVVTADGRILTASAEENPDLYWALRGGSGNFGIATSFDYRLYPLGRVLVGSFAFPISRTREALRRYRDLMISAPDELETFGGLLSLSQGPTLSIGICYCGEEEEGERVVGRWRSTLRPMADNVKWIPYSESADFAFPLGKTSGTGSFLPDLSDELIDILAMHFAAAPPSSTAMWNDYHGAVTRVRADQLAFPLRERGYSLCMTSAWNAPAEQTAATGWVASIQAAVRPFSRGVYVNDMGDEGRVRAREAYGANYARLAALKAKYDSTNFFHLNHNIEPAT